MKKFFSGIRKILMVAIIIIIFFGIVGNLSSKNEKINSVVRFSNFVVLTGSMKPGISPGDYITIIKVNTDNLKVNDIVTYKRNNIVITHKIIKLNKDTITTQGTANNVADPPVSKQQVIGKYLFKIPKIGYIMAFLSSTSGLILITGFLAIIIFWELTDPERGKKVVTSKKELTDEEYAEFLKYKNERDSQKNLN